ncbi:unnamed protein product, partial [Adineta steineri]
VIDHSDLSVGAATPPSSYHQKLTLTVYFILSGVDKAVEYKYIEPVCVAGGEEYASGVIERFAEDETTHPVKLISKPPLFISSPLPCVILTSSICQTLTCSISLNSIDN